MPSIRHTQTLKQTNTFLLQQKLQLLHLMHLSTVALEDYLKNQLEENPVLEENKAEDGEEVFSNEELAEPENKLNEIADFFEDDETPDYKTYVNNSSRDDMVFSAPIAYAPSFREQLKDQVKEYPLPNELRKPVEYLIDSLDDDGYLRGKLGDLTDEYSFANGTLIQVELLEQALKTLQQFDPPGIGARSIQECLLLQLQRKENKSEKHLIAEQVIQNYFTELSHKNFEKIEKAMQLTLDELKEIMHIISHLSPKPVFVASKDWSTAQTIIPDFIINTENDELEIALTANPSGSIKINENYHRILSKDGHTGNQKKEFSYFRKKVNEAKWLIEALQQREHTFLEIVKVIVSIQRDFFLTGDKKNLKPMILEDVARLTGFDPSTISRVTCNKYAQTTHGNILMKDLFSVSMLTTEGEAVSTEKIKQIVIEIINGENKSNPYTDFDLVAQLKERGYNIARRTVAKYREALHLPHARMRKSI
jgi:RNA polymerase sigma-54 factor